MAGSPPLAIENRETGASLQQQGYERDPTRERGRLARTRPGNLQRTLQGRVRHPSQTGNREREPPYSNKVYERDPTRERGRPARTRPRNLQRTLQWRVRRPSQTSDREREPPYSNKVTSETPPGSAGVPPAFDLAICNEPCNGGFAAPRNRVTVNRSLLTATRLRARATRERGRLARIRPGNRATKPPRWLRRTLQGSTREWRAVARIRLRAGRRAPRWW